MKIAIIATFLCLMIASAIPPGKKPTCDPANPQCTMDNGCGGGPCHV